jgi:hypothetical protein
MRRLTYTSRLCRMSRLLCRQRLLARIVPSNPVAVRPQEPRLRQLSEISTGPCTGRLGTSNMFRSWLWYGWLMTSERRVKAAGKWEWAGKWTGGIKDSRNAPPELSSIAWLPCILEPADNAKLMEVGVPSVESFGAGRDWSHRMAKTI